MTGDQIISFAWLVALVVFVFVVILTRRARRGGRSVRVGGIGATYEWLNQDKKNAVEYIVEDRAEARDPEHADGNLPDLEKPPSRRFEQNDGS